MKKDSSQLRAHGVGWPAAALFLGVLGLAFQGSRGIWEPDEGFYVNIAEGMLRTGNWLVPKLSGVPFIEKPPLSNWGMAAGMQLLGVNEWGARLMHALWFIGTALLVGALASSMWNKRTGIVGSLVYGTSLLPYMAANIATTDTPLAFCAVLVFFCYWKADEEDTAGGSRPLWWIALGAAAGLGILAKGPAMLIFLLPLFAYRFIRRGWRGLFLSPWPYLAGLIALAVGLPWYALVLTSVPGAAAFVLDNQVVGRLFTASYRRNSGTFGGFVIYLPMLVLGALPWSGFWPSILRPAFTGPIGARAAALFKELPDRPRLLFVASWIAIPMAILLLARSRLPLYVLPVFAPLALVTAKGLEIERSETRFRTILRIAAGAGVVLIVLKGVAAVVPAQRDSRRLAHALSRPIGSGHPAVFAVDAKCNALPFYGISDFHWITESGGDYPYFVPLPTLEAAIGGLKSQGQSSLFLISPSKASKLSGELNRSGLTCAQRGVANGYGLVACEPYSVAH